MGAGGVLSQCVMTMCAIGEPLAQCLLLGKQWRDRSRDGIASSRCHLARESKDSTSEDLEGLLPPAGGNSLFKVFSLRGFPKAEGAIVKNDSGFAHRL